MMCIREKVCPKVPVCKVIKCVILMQPPPPELYELQPLEGYWFTFFTLFSWKTFYFEKYYLIKNDPHKILHKKGNYQIFRKPRLKEVMKLWTSVSSSKWWIRKMYDAISNTQCTIHPPVRSLGKTFYLASLSVQNMPPISLSASLPHHRQ